MSSETAGTAMAFLCAVVMRGTNKPSEVELKSRRAEAFGVAPLEFMPIFWAAVCAGQSARSAGKMNKSNMLRLCFFI
jgi:hypothetical protein